jgi:ketosteroid isomerase-like protein
MHHHPGAHRVRDATPIGLARGERRDASPRNSGHGPIVVSARPATMSEISPNRRPALAEVPDWVREHYALVDSGDVDRYITDFAADAELRFASHPPVHGRAAIRDALAAGHAEHDMAHTVINCWEVGATTIVEFDVVYTYPDGHSHTVPSVALIERNADGRYTGLRVYVEKPH